MVVFDLYNILKITKGVVGLPFPQNLKDESRGMVGAKFPGEKGKFEGYYDIHTSQSFRGKPLYKLSDIGSWIFMPCYLNGYELPNAFINISGQKTIVETPMTDFEGTVKEIINNQDYNIKLIFTAINNDGSYPEEWLYTVRELYKLKQILTLDCAVSDAFIQAKDNVVITSLNVAEMQGIENAQVFELNLKSDTYMELEIL
jgi:hypothetical protein